MRDKHHVSHYHTNEISLACVLHAASNMAAAAVCYLFTNLERCLFMRQYVLNLNCDDNRHNLNCFPYFYFLQSFPTYHQKQMEKFIKFAINSTDQASSHMSETRVSTHHRAHTTHLTGVRNDAEVTFV